MLHPLLGGTSFLKSCFSSPNLTHRGQEPTVPPNKSHPCEEGSWWGLAWLWCFPDVWLPEQLLPYLLLQQPAWDLLGMYLRLGLTWLLSYTITELRWEHVGWFSCMCGVQVFWCCWVNSSKIDCFYYSFSNLSCGPLKILYTYPICSQLIHSRILKVEGCSSLYSMGYVWQR